MSHGVKLISLSVQHIGALSGRIDLGPFSSGVNVISGRNEAGKSTLVEALRVALFERHDAKNQKIKALQTHRTRHAPEVWVELDIGGERVSVHKRFLENRFAEVRLHREGTVVHGADAEDLLLTRLDGRRPGRTGGTRNDMGLWGLLWVAQDEGAYADPGQALDENVRGALSDAIGRQVGQVMGGKHGERVRTRILEHAARYFTRKISSVTGELRAAEETRAAAESRVKKIMEAKAAVENLAAEYQVLETQLREAEGNLPALEQELAAAVAAESRVQRLEGVLREAEARLATAKVVLQATQKDLDERASLVCESQTVDAELKKSENSVRELAETFERAKRTAAGAREAAGQARTAAAEARRELDAATANLDLARRRHEAARVAADLRAAEEVAGDVAEAARRLESETLDEHAFAQLEELAAKTKALRSRLDAEGTRIVVFPADVPAIVRSVGGPATIDVLGLGVLEVEPARPGLARAVADAGSQRAALDEALLALGVSDVQAARELHAIRAQAEREQETLVKQKHTLAPDGLEALEQGVAALRAERARLEVALDDAARAEIEREESLRSLAANQLDEGVMDGLRRKEQRVAILRAACNAIGTHVEVRALADVRVRVGRAEPPQPLAAGASVPLTLTLATTVIIEDVAEIQLEPRGEDLAKSLAELDQAERDLAATLQALGTASMADAREAARVWARVDAARQQAERRLAEVAPEGIEKLRAEVENARARSLAGEACLTDARKAFARYAQLEVEIAQNRATRDALARLVQLERALHKGEATIEGLQARVRAVAGPVAAGPQRAWVVPVTVRPEPVAGVRWEIVPGELDGGADVDALEQRLREALERASVADLDRAKTRFRAGLTLQTQLTELRKQLRVLAPDGLDALRARAAALGCDAIAPDYEAAVDLAELRMVVETRREQVRMAEESAENASRDADRSQRELRAWETAHGEAAAVRDEKAVRCRIVAEKLAARREIEAESSLHQRETAALFEHNQALTGALKAAAELDAATPQLLRGEVMRAEGAIASCRKSVADLHDKALQRKALLDKAALDGHFEELGEAQVELLEASEALARLERDACAARLLADVMDGAYEESQRLFLAPVVKEATPYLNKLRPGTHIRMTRDLKLDKVVRREAEEDFGQLSGGTREQLSVIVRLALARVLAKDKRPLPLILDDTMGWTDDSRFLSMVQILRDASSELQIILLTCHPGRFDRFQAEYSVDLDRLRDARATS